MTTTILYAQAMNAADSVIHLPATYCLQDSSPSIPGVGVPALLLYRYIHGQQRLQLWSSTHSTNHVHAAAHYLEKSVRWDPCDVCLAIFQSCASCELPHSVSLLLL